MSGSANSHSDPFAIPTIAPLRRLAVRNGLLLDAERWQIAHDYHRQRQNLHYQALHLPGIVCGLEVHVTEPPEDVSARYRDQRWLQVNPGVAIDAHGNLIVVDQPVKVHLASAPADQPYWVYLVVRHVDPEQLQRSQPAEIIAETFRIDEMKQPPGPLDVEVCRLLLPSEDLPLAGAADVFQPGMGELDLRHRQQAQLRPQATVRVGYVTTGVAAQDERVRRSWHHLLKATQALYPALQGDRTIAAINPEELGAEIPPGVTNGNGHSPSAMEGCDLLYLSHRQCLELPEDAVAGVRHHLASGGVVVVELPSRESNFEEMKAVVRELTTAVADLEGSQRFADLRSQLEAERASVHASLQGRIATAQRSLVGHLFPNEAGSGLSEPDDDHPLRWTPFTFCQWPILRDEPLQLYVKGGVVLAIGDLSLAWAPSADLELSRERVRSAQEFGINLLQFAWQRHHWTQSQSPPNGLVH